MKWVFIEGLFWCVIFDVFFNNDWLFFLMFKLLFCVLFREVLIFIWVFIVGLLWCEIFWGFCIEGLFLVFGFVIELIFYGVLSFLFGNVLFFIEVDIDGWLLWDVFWGFGIDVLIFVFGFVLKWVVKEFVCFGNGKSVWWFFIGGCECFVLI